MKLSLEKLKELLPDAEQDRRGKNLRAKCPWCGGDEFGISLDNNHIFGCYRKKKCGVTGNIFTLAKFLKRWDILNIEGEVGRVTLLENKLIQANVEYNLDLPNMSMPMGWKRVNQDDYMDSRGFVEYERYKIGRSVIDPRLRKNYVVIGIEEGGETKGWIGRSVFSKNEIDRINIKRKAEDEPLVLRYINSQTDFAKLVMGYDEIVEGETDTVICVEGIFDKFNVDKLLGLHSQSKIKCNATFKCVISPEQIIKWQIKGIRTLILFYDPDVIDQIKKAAAELQLYFEIFVAFNENGSDPGDITENELSKVFNNLKSPTNFIINKVNVVTLIN